MIAAQFADFKQRLATKSPSSVVTLTPMNNGGALITVTEIDLLGGLEPRKGEHPLRRAPRLSQCSAGLLLGGTRWA